MKLKLKNTCGESVTLVIKPDDTFVDLRERVAEELGLRLDLSDIVNGEHYLETQRVLDFFSQLPQDGDDTLVSNAYSTNVECIVPGCNKTKSTHPENCFFEFPNEGIRNHQWALYCQRLLGQYSQKRLNITSSSRICSDHFKSEQFVKNASTILKKTAVPCINPEIGRGKGFRVRTVRSVINDFCDNNTSDLTSTDNGSSCDFDPSYLLQLKRDKKPFCRLCARYTTSCIYIFDEDEEDEESLSKKINSCLPLNVNVSDNLPKQICGHCYTLVQKSHKFAETAIETHVKLKEKKKPLYYKGVTVLAEAKDKANGNLNITMLCDYSDENISNTRCTLCPNGKMVDACSSFSENLITPYDVETYESDASNELSNHSNGLDSCDMGNMNVDNILSIRSVDKINCLKPLSELNGNMSPLKLKLEPSPDIIKENGNIDKWEAADNAFEFSCTICSADFRSSSDLFPHSLMHSEHGNYVCCLCNFVCENKNDLAVHFKLHSVTTPDTIYHCDTCGMATKSLAMFESHNCSPINWTLNRCDVCHKTFRSESRLKFHKKFHESGAKPGQCELCPKVFSSEIKLYKHVTYLHGVGREHKRFNCEDCGKIFRTLSSLRYHQRVHQGQSFLKPYSCDVCGKSFIRRSMLRNHIATVHKNLTVDTECFMCKVCSELFPCEEAILKHLARMHPMMKSEISFEAFVLNKIYICEYCKRCFASSLYMNNHRTKHRVDLPYECKHCLMEYSNCRDLEVHTIHQHADSFSKEYVMDFSLPVLFVCEYCDRSFLSYMKYNEHLTVHYGPTPYLCRSCNERFADLGQLCTHRTFFKHGEDEPLNPDSNYYRPFECHYCNKSFAIEDALIKHIRMHTGEKPFICDQCGKGFSQSSGLYTHQKVHSNDRPYTCNICPRKFKIKGDRDIHVRKHSGERPYKCEFCGKAFMTQHVYSQHRKIHTGERPYKCDVCHIAFRRSHVLTVHKRIHTGEKPNSCDICGKRYRQKGDMLKHKRIQHGTVRTVPPGPLLN